MSTAAIVGGTLAAGIGGAAISSNAAENAANTQASAAEQAQQLQAQEQQQALDFQKQQWNTTQQNEAPWLQAGQQGLSALQYGLGIGGSANGSGVGQGSLTAQYPGGPFVAPTAQQALNSPGEQAQLQLGEQALQQSAAAQGNLLTGGTAEALNAYAQNLASTNYQNVYNQAYNTYATNYNQYENNQANQYNRLAALSGLGQQTATNLGTLGQNAANNVGNIDLTGGAQQGQQINNAAAANASGIVGAANAWNGGLSSATTGLTNLALLNSLYGGGAYAGSYNNDVLAQNSRLP